MTAQPWQKGWELHIKDVGVTQVKSLARATDQARDYAAGSRNCPEERSTTSSSAEGL